MVDADGSRRLHMMRMRLAAWFKLFSIPRLRHNTRHDLHVGSQCNAVFAASSDCGLLLERLGHIPELAYLQFRMLFNYHILLKLGQVIIAAGVN